VDRRLRFLPVLGALCASAIPRPAHADVGDSDAQYLPERSSRRDGFTAGFHLGGALGGVSGYPNEVAKIDNPAYEQNTGFGGGMGGALWLGLTPRDFFTFGLGLNQLAVAGNGVRSTGTAFMVHAEVFPAFYEGRFYEDLGLFLEAGAGPRNVQDDSNDVVADGGFMSFVGMGAFWEGLRLGDHFSLGPVVEYTHQFSLTLTSNVALVGLRFSYTGGPD
jgi:hypothetical protein